MFTACSGSGRKRKGVFGNKINQSAHWSRRQEWSGKEAVHGVVVIGDRFLLVKHTTGNWDFPGGFVRTSDRNPKLESGEDLRNAAIEYVFNQATISFYRTEAQIFAYGYAIDPAGGETVLVHWFHVMLSTTYPPAIHPNLETSLDARWIATDEPNLGRCLQMRISEYTNAVEGRSFLKESCREFAI